MIWCRGCLMASDARTKVERALRDNLPALAAGWPGDIPVLASAVLAAGAAAGGAEDVAEALRELAAVTRDRNEARDALAQMTMDANVLARERDQARAEREQAVGAMTATIEALMESNRERDEARAEAAHYREALERMVEAAERDGAGVSMQRLLDDVIPLLGGGPHGE